jgi:LCP family protein required for cell wall assembly
MTVTSVQPPPPRLASKPSPKKRGRPPAFAFVILAGMLCAFLFFVGFQLSTQTGMIPVPRPAQPLFPFQPLPGQRIILVMGVDAPNKSVRAKDEDAFEGTRTDTMMLIRVDGVKKKVSLVSIPRDSKVYLAGNRGIDKINAAHAIGGPDLAVNTVQDSFGIPIDNFMVINFRGVRELVDAVGGIDVHIDKPMRYTDRTARLFINFEPGQHHLDGKQAEEFLRFRHDQLGDIGRIRRQQQFIAALAKKMRDPAILFRVPQLVSIASKYIETDMSVNELAGLAFFGKEVNLNAIRSATLPGHPGGVTVSYWIINPEAAQTVLDRLILDNPEPLYSYQNANPDEPLKVGLFYDNAWANALPLFEKRLEQKNYRVVCRQPQRRGTTQIIEHTSRTTDTTTDEIRSLEPRLENARLIFAPVGTTFENNACSVGEDYTLILGADSIQR